MNVARFKVEFYDKTAEKSICHSMARFALWWTKVLRVLHFEPMKLASHFRVFLQVVGNLSFALMAFA